MIDIRSGNLLDVEKGIIVHGCNARGVMGSGIAAQIKKKWGKAYTEYVNHYSHYGLEIGNIVPAYINPDLVIVDAITQETFGRDGYKYVSYDAIDACFKLVETMRKRLGIYEVHFPLIGAGLGGGDFNIIEHIIDSNVHCRKILWVLPE